MDIDDSQNSSRVGQRKELSTGPYIGLLALLGCDPMVT